MNNDSIDTNDKIIRELTDKLLEGSDLHRKLVVKYNKTVLFPWIIWGILGHYPAKSIQGKCEAWYEETLEYINRKLPKSMYSNKFTGSPLPNDPREDIGPLTIFLRTFEQRIKNLETVIVMLRDSQSWGLEKKNPNKGKKENGTASDVLYQVDYNEHDRRILVNGIEVANPDFNSVNEIFFSYVFKHPNKIISVTEIEKTTGQKLGKSPSKIVTELKFSGNLRKIFFPNTSKTSVKFVNPVTHSYAKKHNLPELKVS